MSISLSWRRVAVGLVLLAAIAAVLALRATPSADAQEPPPEFTFVLSDISVTASNGFVSLNAALGVGTGEDDGVLGIACTGAAPLGGTARIPAMVVTDLRATDTQLRVIQANGVVVNGGVQVNCVIDVVATAANSATVERLGQLEHAG